MLPAPKTRRFSLADVLPSSLEALRGQPNPLGLPAVQKVVVVLVDGMGAQALAARAGHARTLAPLMNRASVIDAGFPTTTAAALATLTTGTEPGEHGLVGYSVLDPAHDRVVNQLRGWDEGLDPATWQRMPTLFEQASDAGIPAWVVANDRYRDSGFTRAVLRGAQFRGAATIADRVEAARELLDANREALVYLYIPELDSVGHSDGCESGSWTEQLEEIDAGIAVLAQGLRRNEGMLVTADHGVLDIPEYAHVLFDEAPDLLDGVRFVAGEPRCLQLHFEPDSSEAERMSLVERWRNSEESRAWVATRVEAISAGWFGERVAPEVVPRIGDVLVAARKNVAYYDSRITVSSGRSMIGQHGSISPAESNIPLLRFGAFAA